MIKKTLFLASITAMTSVAYAANGVSNTNSLSVAESTNAANNVASSYNPSTASFQAFENEYNLGYGFSQGTLINGAQNTQTYSTQSLNLEVEHLFDMGVWLDVGFSMLTANNQPNLGPLNGGNGSYTGNPAYNNGAMLNQNPFAFTFQGRVGYAFNLTENTLQLTPYLMLGRNANWATSTILAAGGQNLTEDYFYTGGLGAKLSYRINDVVLLYVDELASYNWDNSGAIKYVQTSPTYYGKSYAATNYGFTSTLGAKFNVYKSLQLGANVFWNNFQPQSNISGLMYTPTNTYGGEVSVGLTY